MHRFFYVLPAAVALLAALPMTSAQAAIRCVDGLQIVNGSKISTPYCQDKYLARVARSYGTRVSARNIRRNPNVKRKICRFIGHDIRVHQACAGSGFDTRGRHR
ncbi:MAG: hypothetical protein ACRBCJ_07575 [Hyphomicrobiaceae bacterium]